MENTTGPEVLNNIDGYYCSVIIIIDMISTIYLNLDWHF